MHTNIICIMLSLNQTLYLQKLALYFYVYLRIIDNINFPNTYNTCSYVQSTLMLIKKSLLTGYVLGSNPCTYFWLYVYIITLTWDRLRK